MKKFLLISTILIILMFGCKPTGKAAFTDGQIVLDADEKIGVGRSVDGSNIELSISYQNLPSDEIIIIADRAAPGLSIVQDSWNIQPAFYDSEIVVWLLTNSPGIQLGSLTVEDDIADAASSGLSYQVSGTATGDFRGKWGLNVAGEEGLFIDDSGGIPPSDDFDYNGDGTVDWSDIFDALDNWGGTFKGRTIDWPLIFDMLDNWTG